MSEPETPQRRGGVTSIHIRPGESLADALLRTQQELLAAKAEAGRAAPDPNAPCEEYLRGWDDCLERVFQTLGERFPRRVRE